MDNCDFTCEYTGSSYKEETFKCSEEVLDGQQNKKNYCMFHDKKYLQDKSSNDEHRRKIVDRLKEIVSYSVSNRRKLLCIGYRLPDIKIQEKFTETVYFNKCEFIGIADFSWTTFQEANFTDATFERDANFKRSNFQGKPAIFWKARFYGRALFERCDFRVVANFSETTFHSEANFFGVIFRGLANFTEANFNGKANFTISRFSDTTYFNGTKFNEETKFHHVLFEDKEKIIFEPKDSSNVSEVEDLSKVSFMNTDITKVGFSDRAEWSKRDKFKIIEEEWLKESREGVTLGSVLAVYRNLRENYEFRLRYDEAGKFFIKEMELKRKYREAPSISLFRFKVKSFFKRGENNPLPEIKYDIVENNWLRRHFSLTGLYYHLSTYGESIVKPTLIGGIIVGLSTLFWLIQANPTHEPSISHIVGFTQVRNITQWQKAFERSFADFLPLLSLGSDVKVGIIDFIIKVIGGAVTFGLLAIALRRKFERKYTR